MHLVPLKVTIGLKTDERGRRVHAYPPFNDLPLSLRDDMDWSYFVDKFGGWHYDKCCGHAEEDLEIGSRRGFWLGMICVPKAFADEACRQFAGTCQVLSDEEAAEFYEHRCHIHEPAVKEDVNVLQAIAAKKAVGIELSEDDANAMDENHPMPGRRKNKLKTWQGFKESRGITVTQ